MTEDRVPEADEAEGSRNSPRGIRQMVSAGALVVIVVSILALGAILKTDSERPPITSSPLPADSSTREARPPEPAMAKLSERPSTSTASTDEAPSQPAVVEEKRPIRSPIATPTEPPISAVADTNLQGLAARASTDSQRLGQNQGKWTLQLLVACKAETVERFLERAPGAPALYLLPVEVKGDACFRVCYGVYATRDAAAAAVPPPSLRSGVDHPSPKEIADLVP